MGYPWTLPPGARAQPVGVRSRFHSTPLAIIEHGRGSSNKQITAEIVLKDLKARTTAIPARRLATYAFGPFRLDTNTREVWRGINRSDSRPKPLICFMFCDIRRPRG
jgi:hypothetical protein